MKFTKAKYEELVLILENDINTCLGWSGGPPLPGLPRWSGAHDVEDRDQLRRYFDDRYEFNQSETNKYAHIPSVWDSPAKEAVEPKDPYQHLRDAMRAGKNIEFRALPNGVWETLRSRDPDRRFPEPVEQYRVVEPVDPYKVFREALANGKAVLSAPHNLCHLYLRGKPDRNFSYDPSCYSVVEPTMANTLNLSTIPKDEPIMATSKPIEITTKTLINGGDAKDLSNADIYILIASEEARIKELSGIAAKPKRISEEISKRQAGIDALVAYLDAQPA